MNADEVASAWQELQSRVPVRLCSLESEQHYDEMIKFMNELLDEIADNESHPLSGLLDTVTMYVAEYEDKHCEIR
jgi:HTH-type transcriptional regulator/antitoxin HigA